MLPPCLTFCPAMCVRNKNRKGVRDAARDVQLSAEARWSQVEPDLNKVNRAAFHDHYLAMIDLLPMLPHQV